MALWRTDRNLADIIGHAIDDAPKTEIGETRRRRRRREAKWRDLCCRTCSFFVEVAVVDDDDDAVAGADDVCFPLRGLLNTRASVCVCVY